MHTVAVDFDGVIHWYREGYQDGTIYDPPAPGALDALRTLMTRYAVYVHTTRDSQEVGEWLSRRGFDVLVEAMLTGDNTVIVDDQEREFWNERDRILVTRRKLPAIAYIDDRAVHHTGDWTATLDAVAALDPTREP